MVDSVEAINKTMRPLRASVTGKALFCVLVIASVFLGRHSVMAEQSIAWPEVVPATITRNANSSFCGDSESYSLVVAQSYNQLDIVSVSLYVEIDQKLTLFMPLSTTPTQGEKIVFCLPTDYAPFASISIKYGDDSCGVAMNVFSVNNFTSLLPGQSANFDRKL